MPKTLFFLLSLFCSFIANAQDKALGISTGTVFSKFVSQHPSYSRESVYRYSFWVSVDYEKRYGKYFQLESSLTYQERIPFEMLPFPMGNEENSFNATILANWPTNPQNEFFNKVGYARRFPNFKYIHLDLVPSVRVGAKVSYSLGFGPFAGILVNQKQTLITKEDFDPDFHSLFSEQNVEPEQRVVDTISYTMFDLGVLPKFSIGFRIQEKFTFGIQAKYYISLYRLNDTLVRREVFQLDNMRWRAILSGIYLRYDIW